MKGIVFTGSYRPLLESDLEECEKSMGISFPQPYRKFLLAHNGGSPHKNLFPLPSECYVQWLYGIAKDGQTPHLIEQREAYLHQLPDNIIPIGLAGTGDRICLSLVSGKIYLFRIHGYYSGIYGGPRARLSELDYLADGMDEFLEKLEGERPPPIESDIVKVGQWGDIAVLEGYLQSGGNINATSSSGDSIVACAASRGHLDFIKECVRRGADLHNKGVLHAAMLGMTYDVVKYLLDQGVDPNEKNRTGRTPLDYAPAHSRGPAVQLMREMGAARTR